MNWGIPLENRFRSEAVVAISPLTASYGFVIPRDRKNDGTPMTNKEIVQGMNDSFAPGDVAAVIAALVDDHSWSEADGFPLGGT